MNYSMMYLSPSEMYERIDQLSQKSEFDRLSPEEAEELDYLSYELDEQTFEHDFGFDF